MFVCFLFFLPLTFNSAAPPGVRKNFYRTVVLQRSFIYRGCAASPSSSSAPPVRTTIFAPAPTLARLSNRLLGPRRTRAWSRGKKWSFFASFGDNCGARFNPPLSEARTASVIFYCVCSAVTPSCCRCCLFSRCFFSFFYGLVTLNARAYCERCVCARVRVE